MDSKILLVYTLLLIPLININAQNYDKLIGISAGGGFCDMIEDEPNYKSNLDIGLLPDISIQYLTKVAKLFYFKTGIGYSKIGGIYEYYTGFNSEKTDTYITSNVLRVPIDIRFTNYKRSKFTSFIQAGINLDFPIGQPKIKTDNELNNPDGFRDNISQGAHSGPIMLSGRFEGGFSLKSDKIIVEPKVFYVRSLTEIYPGSSYSFYGISFSFMKNLSGKSE